jgi:putative transposase
MARPLRSEYEEAFYHITSRGNERKATFYNKSDYEGFKNYLDIAIYLMKRHAGVTNKQ